MHNLTDENLPDIESTGKTTKRILGDGSSVTQHRQQAQG